MRLFRDSPGKGAARPDRRQEWRTAAALMDASFVAGKSESKDQIVVVHGPWTVRVSTFFVQVGNAAILHTGARAHFSGLRELRLRVWRRNAFDRFLEKVGFRRAVQLPRGVLEGHVVKGRPAARLGFLFADSGLTAELEALSSAELGVERAPWRMRRKHGADVGVAWCRRSGLALDAGELAGMAGAVGATLDALERVGEIRRQPSPDAPEAP